MVELIELELFREKRLNEELLEHPSIQDYLSLLDMTEKNSVNSHEKVVNFNRIC